MRDLSVGIDLREIGIENWALTKEQALLFLNECQVPVLGGDVMRVVDGEMGSDFANWSCAREDLEGASDYLKRSVHEAKVYITQYPTAGAFFVLVLGD